VENYYPKDAQIQAHIKTHTETSLSTRTPHANRHKRAYVLCGILREL